MHGHGIMNYADGSKYEGEFREGKKAGQGSRFFASGDRYVGTFESNVMHGTGIYYSMSAQTKRQGEWLNGKRVSWLTQPQPYNVTIDGINRDVEGQKNSNRLYRGGRWRADHDTSLMSGQSPNARKSTASNYKLGVHGAVEPRDSHYDSPAGYKPLRGLNGNQPMPNADDRAEKGEILAMLDQQHDI